MPSDSIGSTRLVPFGNSLYFTSFNPGVDIQLWKTDGTAAGTAPVTKIPGGGVSFAVVGTGPADGAIYFVNADGPNPAFGTFEAPVLFQTDGTTAGIKIVRRFGPNAYDPSNLTAVGSTLFFTSNAPSLGEELWKVMPTPKAQIVAVGAGIGSTPLVRVYDAATGKLKFTLLAAPQGFKGGVRVAVGDVNGDGVDDIITGAGPGGGPVVKVFDGTDGHLIRALYAYAPNFTGGVFVAVGDVNLDGYADIITGAGPGGGPHVEVFSGKTGQLIRSFYAYAPNFAGGVTVATGDVDGTPDVITGAGRGGAPLVRVFDGLTGAVVGQFLTFDVNYRGGVTVAAADMNADGNADIVVGTGPGYVGGPDVWVVSGLNLGLMRIVLPYDARFGGGVTVAAADINGDGRASLITGPGPGGGPDVRVFGGSAATRRFNAFNPAFLGGVWVG